MVYYITELKAVISRYYWHTPLQYWALVSLVPTILALPILHTIKSNIIQHEYYVGFL